MVVLGVPTGKRRTRKKRMKETRHRIQGHSVGTMVIWRP